MSTKRVKWTGRSFDPCLTPSIAILDVEITVVESPSTGDNKPPPFAFQLAGEIRKRRNAAGLSQPALAALIGYTRQYVSLAERPRRGVASAELVKAIDSALGAGGALVSLRQQAVAERKEFRSGAPARDAAVATAHGPSQPPSAAEVQDPNHSELVAVAAAITFGARLERPVETIIAAADEPQVPNRIRVGDVRHLRNTVEKLEELDHHAGGGAVRHHGVAALRWATAMLNSSCTPEVRCELAATTAHLADLAGWATFDSGHHSAARQLFLLGLHAARESGDLGVRAHVASGLARLEIHTGHWAAGLELTQLAFTATEALTPTPLQC